MIGKFVYGEGPENAYVMLVGEAPGRMEASIGRPFCGVSGLELNRYLLMQAGIRRSDCYVTNLVKYRPDEDNSDPTEEEIERDAPILLEEIKHVNPKVIVPVGRIATRFFLGPDADMEFVYSLPHWNDRFACYIFPVYHPAAGLHQADKYSKFVYNGFKRLGAYLNGALERNRDDLGTVYQEIGPGLLFLDTVAVDTEGYPEKPWGLSATTKAGQAVVTTGAGFNYSNKIIFHNSLWDLKVLRGMGISIPYEKIEDTMIMAHLLCLEPKKLKALAYREAGMEMEEYKDVIKEADDRISRLYLHTAFTRSLCEACKGSGEIVRPWKKNPNKTTTDQCSECGGDGSNLPKPTTQLVFNDDFTAKFYTPESTGKRLRTILSADSDYRSKWYDLSPTARYDIEGRFGRFPEVSLDDVEPRERAINYSARDADATLRVFHRLKPRIVEMDLQKAYEIDLGCIPIIDRMHQNGILIDKDYFYALDKQFEKDQYDVLDKLYAEVGAYFNPSSTVQIKKILEQHGVKNLDTTRERDLRLLMIKKPELKPIIENGIKYRELNKMRGNYTTKLAEQADNESRIHTTFILSAQEGEDSAEAPSTGRLSSRNPNLQNIPVAAEGPGSLIRKGFIAGPSRVLLSCDLSQIELRVGAHLAHEEGMIEAFRQGLDIHTATAAKIFKIPYDQVDRKKHRYPCKSINFGVFYGMSKYRLQSELAVEGLPITLDGAQGFIDAWFETYPGIRTYMYQVQAEARQNYYVRTLFGHIRYLPNVHSKDPKAQAEALRQAGNHGVQGSAGEILKIAMANIHKKVYPVLSKIGYFEPLLSIHDEVIFEVDESIADIAEKMVAYEMENAVQLDVPLLSSSKTAKSWADLKD